MRTTFNVYFRSESPSEAVKFSEEHKWILPYMKISEKVRELHEKYKDLPTYSHTRCETDDGIKRTQYTLGIKANYRDPESLYITDAHTTV